MFLTANTQNKVRWSAGYPECLVEWVLIVWDSSILTAAENTLYFMSIVAVFTSFIMLMSSMKGALSGNLQEIWCQYWGYLLQICRLFLTIIYIYIYKLLKQSAVSDIFILFWQISSSHSNSAINAVIVPSVHKWRRASGRAEICKDWVY